ncbi:hypothetical protein ACUY1T_09310 [Billgrantia sp. Q4P2]|uniref:hypothetical protein n=1 Tax=Billgrantia sp. Q4P2 TaxID=3463857 RepID=UPI00405795C8
MKFYTVRRHKEVSYLTKVFTDSGIEIKSAPSPNKAPFIFDVRLPDGSEYKLICYAFSANKYNQGSRPDDEHRFQVKYGSNFKTYHRLHISKKKPSEITLMFGIHFERDLIIAVDPSMHEVTWFSKSIEFKEADLDTTAITRWHGWERQRVVEGRRKLPLEEESLKIETLLGLGPENFITYIKLEAVAGGLDSGTRLQIIDYVNQGLQPSDAAAKVVERSVIDLEDEMGLDIKEIADEVSKAFRLKVALRGSIAERHLAKFMQSVPGVNRVERLDLDGQPDLIVNYKGSNYSIECKNVLRRKPKSGFPKVDFQKTRASKNNPCSRYYSRDQFDILAACLEPVTEAWEFRFCPVFMLESHMTCKGKLSHRVFVDTRWENSAESVLDILASR